MLQYRAEDWTPRFLLRDKNGYALAKALEAGLNAAGDTAARWLRALFDYDEMPEWRLDELAWETGCPYDSGGDVEKKRRWVRDARALYRLYGTPAGIERYLDGYAGGARVQEAAEYGGEAYHFRAVFPEGWDEETIAWANKAVTELKNVRSVFDGLCFSTEAGKALYCGPCALYTVEKGTFTVPGAEEEET